VATYDTLESSLELGRPVELYRFAIGSEEYLYTTSEDEIPIGLEIFTPESIRRNSTVAQGRDERQRELTITLPASNPFASQWKEVAPGLPGFVTIIRVQRDETPSIGTTQAVEFNGIVRGAEFPEDGQEIILGITSEEAATGRPIPRFSFSAVCNHFLYDPGCGVDPNAHKVTAAVSAESGSNITVPGVGAFADQTFRGGYVKPFGLTDFRLITSQVGDVLTLNRSFKNSILGLTVDAFKGCDFIIDSDCLNVFNNVIEFGGFPFVPTKNPFQSEL